MRSAAATLLFLLVPFAASAQEMNLATLGETTNLVHVRGGAEYGFVGGVGYTRVVRVAGRPVALTADATMPWATLDLFDYRVRVGATAPLVTAGRWRVAGALAPTVRGNDNEISRMLDLGVDASVLGGRYTPRWFAAGEVGFDWALTTHVTHSDFYRATVYAGARNGWYANPGGNLRAGLQAGVSVSRYDVVLRAGMVRATDGEPPLLPFYGTLAVNARW